MAQGSTHQTTTQFAKPHRPIGDPVAAPPAAPRFYALPQPMPAHLELPLSAILPDAAAAAKAAGCLMFHAVGDTGGINGDDAQKAVADAMEAQITQAADKAKPSFLFHLGDVVYFNGVSTLYPQQFYEPYQHYPAPIFAIPGNHDGDNHPGKNDPPDSEPSLYGFMQNFCSPTQSYLFKHRPAMTQPYCHWTLQAPFVHIIGLYSNVDGQLDARGTVQQQTWLQQQIAACPADKWLVVTVHHPCFSLDSAHGGYQEILDVLDKAAVAAKRWPDAVLSGHVHDYQRFSRSIGGGEIPYIVAGAGGYANVERQIHQLQKGLDAADDIEAKGFFATTRPDVKLCCYNCEDSGFLRVTAAANALTFEYFAVPFEGEPETEPYDSVSVSARSAKTP